MTVYSDYRNLFFVIFSLYRFIVNENAACIRSKNYPLHLKSSHHLVECSGGASAVKESGHFEVRKSSSQVTRMHFFPQKSWRPFSKLSPSKHRPPMPFHRRN